MIQRIQTVYLLLVVGVLIASMCLPLGHFTDPKEVVYTLNSLEVSSGDVSQSAGGLFAILLLSAIVAVATIFLYKNRVLQIRMTIFNMILMVAFYLAFIIFYFIFKKALEASFCFNWVIGLPLAAMLLNYLATRAIRRDEVLVKAADRLR